MNVHAEEDRRTGDPLLLRLRHKAGQDNNAAKVERSYVHDGPNGFNSEEESFVI